MLLVFRYLSLPIIVYRCFSMLQLLLPSVTYAYLLFLALCFFVRSLCCFLLVSSAPLVTCYLSFLLLHVVSCSYPHLPACFWLLCCIECYSPLITTPCIELPLFLNVAAIKVVTSHLWCSILRIRYFVMNHWLLPANSGANHYYCPLHCLFLNMVAYS